MDKYYWFIEKDNKDIPEWSLIKCYGWVKDSIHYIKIEYKEKKYKVLVSSLAKWYETENEKEKLYSTGGKKGDNDREERIKEIVEIIYNDPANCFGTSMKYIDETECKRIAEKIKEKIKWKW